MPTILITGASRGIGLELVRQYAAEGADIVAACRDPAKADKLQTLAATHENIRLETLNVIDAKSIAALAEKLKDATIDILVNNAGLFSGAPGFISPDPTDRSQIFGTIDPEAWERVLRTNSIAPVIMTQAFASHLARSKQGKVIMISSIAGSIAQMSGEHMAYYTSKAALNAAMVVLSRPLRARNIATVSVHPGWVKTDMGGSQAPFDVAPCIAGVRKVIAALSVQNTGQFVGYDGTIIPW